MVEGVSTLTQRSERIVLEAHPAYWDPTRMPRLKRIIIDNSLGQKEAVELVKSGEGQVDLVTDLSPLETLRVAQSAFGTVVKNRGPLVQVFGQFNMRKEESPWRDVRLRQAINYAINREHLIQYAAKGNGLILPALVPRRGFGYDPDLAPYPFDPTQARQLLREAGHPDGLAISLIAPEDLAIHATVVGKMLEQVGLTVDLQLLGQVVYNQKVDLSRQDQRPEQQPWDIALASWSDVMNFPVFQVYHHFALDGPFDWVREQPELHRLYAEALRTVDREQQQELIRQMERHTRDQAYFLFLYNPIKLYAVNKAVEFVPHVSGNLILAKTSVTEQHWSVRKQKAAMPER